MTLVKNKKRITTHQKRVAGEHHRKNKQYMKPYWPYLPIVLILGGAVVANDYLPASFSSSIPDNASGARINSVVGGRNDLLILGLSLTLIVLCAWFALRHAKRLKRIAVNGEKLLARNFMLDVVGALLIAGLYVMLR